MKICKLIRKQQKYGDKNPKYIVTFNQKISKHDNNKNQ